MVVEQVLGLVPDQIISALELVPWWVVLLFKIYVGFNGAMFALRWYLKGLWPIRLRHSYEKLF